MLFLLTKVFFCIHPWAPDGQAEKEKDLKVKHTWFFSNINLVFMLSYAITTAFMLV